ncbi:MULTISPECIES: phage tail protein [Klebsiella/Raoultella group]|uniref:phage tail protein n=1 Tax=Klebsiella/Raoultella group TaxID=2890311 RepID=UPI0010AED78D|nr:MULTISPECIES: phage tail protein [Klebsiella/Raoultella group]EIW8591202.1 phage tail protein [Klebsiella pneumoniae]EIW8622270.1 phage tail protein [Klebsiella pneumoniae]EIW9021050.1 phage tail protein [Klebsiella pneumoniae]EIW9037802.1 phage tail protein [Klebsiella pneumoniae]MBE0328438.1 phage tail protein [Klebsiella pneumoniae]
MTTLFPWLADPDWSRGVTEQLEWKTDVLQSPTGAEQRISRRLSPRRTFEFTTLVHDTGRQRFENMLWQGCAGTWAMPVYPDVFALPAAVSSGVTALSIPTAGRDFTVGGTVLLKTDESPAATSRMGTIAGIAGNVLQLASPLTDNWPAGSLVYPVRKAVLTEPPSLSRLTGSATTAQVRFRIAEHNTFSDAPVLTQYRGHPVLESETDWGESVSGSYQPLIRELDNSSSIPYRLDTAGRPFWRQTHNWFTVNRQAQTSLRQLLWYLRGRQRPIWVPGQTLDFSPRSTISGNYVDVVEAGFTELGIRPGRRDICILLADGTRYYRRIAAVSLVSGAERLVLDGDAINTGSHPIVSVSLMTLARQDTDSVSWEHVTDADGVARVATTFTGVRDELE